MDVLHRQIEDGRRNLLKKITDIKRLWGIGIAQWSAYSLSDPKVLSSNIHVVTLEIQVSKLYKGHEHFNLNERLPRFSGVEII